MKLRTAYCSACDRNVRVVVRGELLESGEAALPDPAELVCLEYGETCTGDMCPLFEVPTEQMRKNLVRLVGERLNGRP